MRRADNAAVHAVPLMCDIAWKKNEDGNANIILRLSQLNQRTLWVVGRYVKEISSELLLYLLLLITYCLVSITNAKQP